MPELPGSADILFPPLAGDNMLQTRFPRSRRTIFVFHQRPSM